MHFQIKKERLGLRKQYPQRARTQFVVGFLLQMFFSLLHCMPALSPLHALTQITEGMVSFSEDQQDNLTELMAEKSFLFAL